MGTAQEPPPLTSLSHGAGCACKIGAAQLHEIRARLPAIADPHILVGLDPADDAAVYRLSDDLALVQTIDFFTPIVDDPFQFGRIAAANALSDVYAMGARPVLALNVLAFSVESLGAEVLSAILAGGGSVAAQAGIAIAGGHSIDDSEPKYGMAVSGLVDPNTILTKAGAEPGDLIFLTKPIGSGLITTAAKRGLADSALVSMAIEVMTTLNADAAEQAQAAGVHAMTDVTGFGLLGHLHEMCLAAELGAVVDAAAVPALDGALELATSGDCQAGGSRRNAEHAANFTRWDADVSADRRVLLTDAMTSGGLLMAVPKDRAALAPGVRIGKFVQEAAGTITVSAGSGPDHSRPPRWNLQPRSSRAIAFGQRNELASVDDLLARARSEITRLSPAGALAAMRTGATLIDIRSTEQRDRDGLLPDARVIPRNVVEWRLDPQSEHRDPDVARLDRQVIVICDEGYQSSLVAATLRRFGLDATDVIGGVQAWRTKGLRLCRTQTNPGKGTAAQL